MAPLKGPGNLIIQNDKQRGQLDEVVEILKWITKSVIDACIPGVTTKDLDDYIGACIYDRKVQSAPKKFYNFPSFSCISINEEMAHGVGSDRRIQKEDLVKLDISIYHPNAICGDMCRTVYHGEDSHRQHLVDVAKLCVEAATKDLKAGDSVCKIGKAIEETAFDNNAFVVEQLKGHGIGRELHEHPTIPTNFSTWQVIDAPRLREGELICIEPVVTWTDTQVYANGLVYISGTGAHSAQHEDMILVCDDNVINLTGEV